MGLDAYFYRSKTKSIRRFPLHERGNRDSLIGYFRNNFGLHGVINPDHTGVCLLDLETLEDIKEAAIESQELVAEGFYQAGCYDDVNKGLWRRAKRSIGD